MADDAAQLLRELTTRETLPPLTREAAAEHAAAFRNIALQNGIGLEELEAAAGTDLPSYLMRTFGEVGQELEI